MIEKPPILQGSTSDQVRALRDYLYKLAGTLDGSIQAATALQNVSVSVDKQGRAVVSAGGTKNDTAAAIRKSAEELKALILKSADEVYHTVEHDIDTQGEWFRENYVANSEYGSFTENIDSRIETTARQTIESYNYSSAIQGLQTSSGAMEAYINDMRGQIRRGIIWDPSENRYVTGIAISEDLEFTGTCPPTDPNNPNPSANVTYYYIKANQTFGLYTSRGWQFWLAGVRKGWFNSEQNVLWVYDMVIENTLKVGKALFDMNTRFDIKPVIATGV